jgi:hypothetical protein
MLLMDITTFEPEQGVELLKRWGQVEGMDLPEGLKVINQWFDAGGGRVITLYDVQKIEDYMAYNFPFTDLCEVEVFPVIEGEDFQKFVAGQVEKLRDMGICP